MIKAIFFDIDGTLLSHKTMKVPESTKKALRLLKEQGILTFIATGRHISEMKDLPIDDLEFEGNITLNGQYCYNKEDKKDSKRISEKGRSTFEKSYKIAVNFDKNIDISMVT